MNTSIAAQEPGLPMPVGASPARCIEVPASSVAIVLERLPATAGVPMTGVRAARGDLYRARSRKLLRHAAARWHRDTGADLVVGSDLSKYIASYRRAKRYIRKAWADGLLMGRGAITAAGVEALRELAAAPKQPYSFRLALDWIPAQPPPPAPAPVSDAPASLPEERPAYRGPVDFASAAARLLAASCEDDDGDEWV